MSMASTSSREITQDGRRLSGWKGDPGYFRVAELDAPDWAMIEAVLRQRLLGVVIRGYADSGQIAEILTRFRNSSGLRLRETEARSEYVGTYHYQRPPERYLQESTQTAPVVAEVLEAPGSPWLNFWDDLGAHLSTSGTTLRPARSGDAADESCHGLVRSWLSQNNFALVPHEDSSQVRDPVQAGFEIAGAADQVCAVNLCLANGAEGRLFIWNIKPDETSRNRLGCEIDGGPYPEDELTEHEVIRLEVRPGDLYLFNSGHVHAVEHHEDYRATAAALLGFADDRLVLRWT